MDKYPDTPQAKEAKAYYGSILRKMDEGDFLTKLEKKKEQRMALLNNSCIPERIWKKCSLPPVSPQIIADRPQNMERDRKFMRLAQVLDRND